MITFQQSEATAAYRRWMLHLVDATDGITPETGVTGQGYISKNGATAVQTTNSIVEVDATNMPGFYYLELTASELDTLGFIGFRFDTAATAEFQDRALVSYNDPYISAGGFSGGSSGNTTITKKQLDYIVEHVWKHEKAKELLDKTCEHEPVDLNPVMDRIGSLNFPEVDLSPVMSKIDSIKIPEPKDHTALIADLKATIKTLEQASLKDFKKVVSEFSSKMNLATKEINGSLDVVEDIQEAFDELNDKFIEFSQKVEEMSDMDKRFEVMTSTMQKQQLAELTTKFEQLSQKLLVALTDNKYDILDQISK